MVGVVSKKRATRTVGQTIREARMARGWTQEYLARELGVSSITVSRWERGVPPAQRHRQLLAEALSQPSYDPDDFAA